MAAEWLFGVNDHAFIELLWKMWSPAYDDRAHVARIKRMLAMPGHGRHAGVLPRDDESRQGDPALAAVTARLADPITTPTRVLCGSRDMRREMLARQADLFAGPYEWGVVQGAGHFLHRERPGQVNADLIDWLAREDS